MLESIFIQVLNMSFIGSFVILIVMLLRITMKKMPKKYSYYLWIVPLIRLAIPFSFESIVSLIPVSAKPIPQDIGFSRMPTINSGIRVVDSTMNSSLPVAGASVNPMQIVISIGTVLWIVGLVTFIIYGLYSFKKMKQRLSDAQTNDGKIYISKKVNTAFVLGIMNPKIYLPTEIQDTEIEYILCHEHTHIKRFDHIVRLISYMVLGLHWFNPAVWIAFYLSGKDMEMSCDEAVIEQLGRKVKTDYSQSLLNLSTTNYRLNISPLAFGEGNTKGRIKNVLSYKQPKLYLTIIAVVVLVIAFIGLLTNPLTNVTLQGNNYNVQAILFNAPAYSFTYTVESAPRFSISKDYYMYTKESHESNWSAIGALYEADIKKEELLSWIQYTEVVDDKLMDIIDKKPKIYKAETKNENGVFYLVLETKAHEVLILYGYDTEEVTLIRWIFDVTPMESVDISVSSRELWLNRTKYIGDNSAVANITSRLEYPDKMVYQGISLQTESTPYLLSVNLEDKRENISEITDENVGALYERNACILFSLIENLDQVVFVVKSELYDSKPVIYTRDWAYGKIGVDLWMESETEEAFADLLILITDEVSND